LQTIYPKKLKFRLLLLGFMGVLRLAGDGLRPLRGMLVALALLGTLRLTGDTRCARFTGAFFFLSSTPPSKKHHPKIAKLHYLRYICYNGSAKIK
jgi:hypothetical protein